MNKIENMLINKDYLDLYTLCDLLNKDSCDYESIYELRHEIINEIKSDSNNINFEPHILSIYNHQGANFIISNIYNKTIKTHNNLNAVSLCKNGINLPNILFSSTSCTLPLNIYENEDNLAFKRLSSVLIIPEFISFLYYEFLEEYEIFDNNIKTKLFLREIAFKEWAFKEWISTIEIDDYRESYNQYIYDIENINIYKYSILSDFKYLDSIIRPWIPVTDNDSQKNQYKSIERSLLWAEKNLK